MRMNPDWAEFFCTGPLSLKKAWCSTAHFHRCLQALGWSILKTKVCSCSLPWEGSFVKFGRHRRVDKFSLKRHTTCSSQGGHQQLEFILLMLEFYLFIKKALKKQDNHPPGQNVVQENVIMHSKTFLGKDWHTT